MRTTDILEHIWVFSAPLGFGISLVAGSYLLRGKGRALSVAALACFWLAFGTFLYANKLPYSSRRLIEGIGVSLSFATLFTVYLRHTYFPTTLRWVNLPATLGLGVSFAALTLFIFLRI